MNIINSRINFKIEMKGWRGQMRDVSMTSSGGEILEDVIVEELQKYGHQTCYWMVLDDRWYL
jgi:hypothetical protein